MNQIQLSSAQAVILSTACKREDRLVFPVTAKLKGGAVGNVCKSLLKHGLIEEAVATDHNTVYRHDEQRGPVTLRATPLAYRTLGVKDPTDTGCDRVSMPEAALRPTRRRSGTKQEALITMLRAPDGATIEEIGAALLWAPHTIRGAMAGALKKKLGLKVSSEKVEDRGRVYKLPAV
jgi:hypothetical protein